MNMIQTPDGSDGWINEDPDEGYSMHFMDSGNGAISSPPWINVPFTYTLIDKNKFEVVRITGFDTMTIINLDNDNLILEVVSNAGTRREHYIRGEVPNPLSFVAKYNINTFGLGFVTDSIASNVSGYFTYEEIVPMQEFVFLFGGYFIPTVDEWRAIIPDNNHQIPFGNLSVMTDLRVTETVTVQNKSITMTSDYAHSPDSYPGCTSALRYVGTSMVSAWRYEYVKHEEGLYYLKVTSRSLFGKPDIDMTDIARRDEFWLQNTEEDIVRYFPASGYQNESGATQNQGTNGYYWSYTPHGNGLAVGMSFGPSTAYTNYVDKAIHKYSLRLFRSRVIE
jgi:hypothetical protein